MPVFFTACVFRVVFLIAFVSVCLRIGFFTVIIGVFAFVSEIIIIRIDMLAGNYFICIAYYLIKYIAGR